MDHLGTTAHQRAEQIDQPKSGVMSPDDMTRRAFAMEQELISISRLSRQRNYENDF
jgi:hypothetical protein